MGPGSSILTSFSTASPFFAASDFSGSLRSEAFGSAASASAFSPLLALASAFSSFAFSAPALSLLADSSGDGGNGGKLLTIGPPSITLIGVNPPICFSSYTFGSARASPRASPTISSGSHEIGFPYPGSLHLTYGLNAIRAAAGGAAAGAAGGTGGRGSGIAAAGETVPS